MSLLSLKRIILILISITVACVAQTHSLGAKKLMELKNSLNPLTIYRYNLRDTTLTTQPNWNIV